MVGSLKLLIKLAIVALVANACWQLGSAYARFYRFKDAVHESALFGSGRSEPELQQRVVDLAAQYDLAVTTEDFTIRRENDHTYIDGATTIPIQFTPWYTRDWKFTWNIDTYVARPVRAGDAVH